MHLARQGDGLQQPQADEEIGQVDAGDVDRAHLEDVAFGAPDGEEEGDEEQQHGEGAGIEAVQEAAGQHQG